MIDPVILPPAVRPGQRAIGVAAISGAVDAGRLDRGIRALEALGFRVVEASNLRTRQGLFAGSDAERLAGLHRLVADPEVGAIVFARGGWGAPRLLGAVDWDLLAAHPKAYVGYSDLTPFLLAITARLGLATFHGPMVAADLARG
ncbi:MAG: LD-carboxypeptidase, partial [Acidobacteriota bacterium]